MFKRWISTIFEDDDLLFLLIICNVCFSTRRTACRTCGKQPSPPRFSFRETTPLEPSASSRPSSQPSWRTGCVEIQSKHKEIFTTNLHLQMSNIQSNTDNCLLLQIDKQQFDETINSLNNLYAEAEKLGGRSYLEGCLACLTAYTIFLCMETHYEKVSWSSDWH